MSICSACGTQFSCAMVDGISDGGAGDTAPACWCTSLPALLPVPSAGAGASCYCPQCLQQLLQQQAFQQQT